MLSGSEESLPILNFLVIQHLMVPYDRDACVGTATLYAPHSIVTKPSTVCTPLVKGLVSFDSYSPHQSL